MRTLERTPGNAAATPAPGASERARRRMARAGERPFCLADWSRVLFVHYAVDPAVLQPHVPFALDLFRGRAYVSLVAFTQHNVRPQFAGGLGRLGRRLAAWCAAPVAAHRFLNLRTYVRRHGERGIYFLAEWINNRIDRVIGPAAYGLPYRLGRLRYDYDAAGRPTAGEVCAGDGTFRFDAPVDAAARFAPAPGGLDRFLLERYTAYTRRGDTPRRFRIWHAPWTQARAVVTTHATELIARAAPWFVACRYAGAAFSPGVTDLRIGPPRRLRETTPRTTERRLRLAKVIARTALGAVWVYEGLVPKLLFTTQHELDLVARSHLYWPTPRATLVALALGEILGGLWLLTGRAERVAAALSVVLIAFVASACAAFEPSLLYHPFGAISKNLGLVGCAAVVWLLAGASPCKKSQAPEQSGPNFATTKEVGA
jgi:hypothetical protein